MRRNVPPPQQIAERILLCAAQAGEISRSVLNARIREALSGTRYAFPKLDSLWDAYRKLTQKGELAKNERLERVLRVKDVRTDSGIAPVTVLTKPYPCPGKCVYCPRDERLPKSYIASEPAAARALNLKFDPYDQVTQRVMALERNGHEAKKIELIVKGGTWSAYPWDYRRWFIQRCFEAANDLRSEVGSLSRSLRLRSGQAPSRDLSRALRLRSGQTPSRDRRFESREINRLTEAQKINETAIYRIVGLTIETRPDWINAQEIIRLRELGCTRVELGAQSLRDKILETVKRGHTVADTVRAVALLKQAGFKTDFHIMPGLPGSTPQSDLEDFETLFADPRFRPDMIKIYPCVVMPSAELNGWTERGEFKPIEGEELKELLIRMQTTAPRYCRISRVIRDFPARDIASGNKVTNLREQIEAEMKRRGLRCQCLRCREAGHVPDLPPTTYNLQPVLFQERYQSAGGREVFLSMEDEKRKAVFAFLRLRLPGKEGVDSLKETEKIRAAFPVLDGAAIVRELHTYGRALDLKQTSSDAAQHRGHGRRLMEEAEAIAKREGYSKIAVISGIGVREYYRGLGYEEQDTYMVKEFRQAGWNDKMTIPLEQTTSPLRLHPPCSPA